jgi:hypothetical protein
MLALCVGIICGRHEGAEEGIPPCPQKMDSRAVQHRRWERGTAKAGASDISPPPKFIVTDVKRAQSVLDPVVCELLGGDLFGSLQRSSDFAWAGPSSIRASSIRAIVIMMSAVETSRISGLFLKLAV